MVILIWQLMLMTKFDKDISGSSIFTYLCICYALYILYIHVNDPYFILCIVVIDPHVF